MGAGKWKREGHIRRKSVSQKLHMKRSVKVHQILFHDTKKTEDTTPYAVDYLENQFDHLLSTYSKCITVNTILFLRKKSKFFKSLTCIEPGKFLHWLFNLTCAFVSLSAINSHTTHTHTHTVMWIKGMVHPIKNYNYLQYDTSQSPCDFYQ